MGGSMQHQGQVQELVNIIDLGMNVQAAGDAARFRHDQTSNSAEIESNLYELVGAELEEMGHDLERTDGTPMGGYQAIMFVPDPNAAEDDGPESPVAGVYRAGPHHRKDGGAVVWCYPAADGPKPRRWFGSPAHPVRGAGPVEPLTTRVDSSD